jgi:hypothetical protein
MQVVVNPKWNRLSRGLALALAMVSLFLLLQLTAHGHKNGQDEAACLLCQVAHIGVTPALAAIVLSAPIMEFRAVSLQTVGAAPEAAADNSPSRAPPSFVL